MLKGFLLRYVVGLFGFGLVAQGLAIEPVATIPGVKLAAPPVIDGVVDLEKEWKGAPSGSGLFDEMSGQKAPYETQFWFAYDEKYIYFAAKMTDPDPKSIKATAYQTNVSLRGDDAITLSIDPFGKLNDFNSFSFNPRGATKISIAGGRAAKREWIGEFVAKGRITDQGWEAEARIPWALMRLPSSGPRNLRMDVIRYHAKTERWLEWGYTTSQSAQAYPVWEKVVIPKVENRRTLKLLPFGYLGAVEGGADIFDGGLDFKGNITDQIEAVGSIKPDFRNVETQILSLDFSHFERIATESRPFFMEGEEQFDPTYDSIQFASQRITDFDIGLKTFGKLSDRTNFGIMNVHTLGDMNATVAAFSHKVDDTARLSFIGTNLDGQGNPNKTAGIYVSKRLGSYYLGGHYVESRDDKLGRGYTSLANLQYSIKGWYFYGYYTETDPTFKPAIGFAPQVDQKGGLAYISYENQPKGGLLRAINANVIGNNYINFDGTHYRSYVSGETTLTWKNGMITDLSAGSGRFLDVDEHLYSFLISSSNFDQYRNWKAGVSWGSQSGADYFTPTIASAYRPYKNLQLSLRYQFLDFYGTSDQAVFTASYDMGNDNGISTRVVKREKDWNAYVSFRRSGNRGTEYYLIVGDPNALTFKASVILKVTVPIEIRF